MDQGFPARYFLWPLGLLTLVIMYLGITSRPDDPPAVPVNPPTTTKEAGVAEERLQLNDGQVILCLVFPGQPAAVSCDWTASRYRAG